MKDVKKHLESNKSSPEDILKFEEGAKKFAKRIISEFKSWEFFTGESMDPSGM